MRIICDMDEVIVDMMGPLLCEYNKRYGADINIDDITQWQLPGDMMDIFYSYNFFAELPVIPRAVHGLNLLGNMGHEIIIASNSMNVPEIAYQKTQWVDNYLRRFKCNLILTARKDLLQGDVIIDDNPDYLINSPCPIKICMDRPWNRELGEHQAIGVTAHGDEDRFIMWGGDIDYRVHNWQDILKLFEGGAFKVW